MDKTLSIKSTAKRVLSHPALPFVVLWLVLLACHLGFVMEGGDEVYYARQLAEKGFIDFSVYHYLHWSARTLIEIVESIVAFLPKMVWRLLNPVVATLTAVCISNLIGAKKETLSNWVVCGFMLLYNWPLMRTAGWISTTLVYMWPGLFALLAMQPLAQLARGETPKTVWCVLSLSALLYAANMEQIAVLYTLLLLLFVGYRLYRRQNIHWLCAAQGCVCALNLIYMLLSPGMKERVAVETTQWFPNYAMRSVFQNAELGVSTALSALIYNRDYVFAFFCILLAWVIWRRHKNIFYRLLALFPPLVTLALGMYQRFTLAAVPGLAFFTGALNGEGIITLSNVNTPAAYLPLLLLYTVFVVCVVNLYLALGHTPLSFACMAALVCGLLSRVMMGFSPTVWTSGDRTGYFFSLCIMGIACILFRQVGGKKGWGRILFLTVFCAYCLLQIYSIAEM